MNFGYSLLISFTFQYVSIISGRIYKRVYELCKIYIPICFYYFDNEVYLTEAIYEFTFQYVSIISSSLNTNKLILVQFTFQYVSIISDDLRGMSLTASDIYIPICFYYFSICGSSLSYQTSIYIPICFYYFQKHK